MRLAILGLFFLLGGCESTSFQAPPVAESACDPALVGDWRPGDGANKDGDDVELRIDPQCQLDFAEDKDGKHREGPPTKAHVGSDGDRHYLWVDAAWAVTRFDLKQAPPPGDLFLVRYRFKDGQLLLTMTDDRTIAHRIIDGRIRGDIHRVDGDLRNRLLAPADPAVLREPGFFELNETLLRRKSGENPP